MGDGVVDDDEVEGEEGVAADVDDLEAGEGEDGELVDLGLVHTTHEQHLLLQT